MIQTISNFIEMEENDNQKASNANINTADYC